MRPSPLSLDIRLATPLPALGGERDAMDESEKRSWGIEVCLQITTGRPKAFCPGSDRLEVLLAPLRVGLHGLVSLLPAGGANLIRMRLKGMGVRTEKKHGREDIKVMLEFIRMRLKGMGLRTEKKHGGEPSR